MIIQIILIAISFAVLLYALSSRETHAINAWKKIGIILMAFIAIIAILLPEVANKVANLLGVGRGADLLLYLLFAAFIFHALSQYIKGKDQQNTLFRLARRVAIIEASERYVDRLK